MVTIAKMLKNYEMEEEIELLKEIGLQYWRKFDFSGDIRFYHCEYCDIEVGVVGAGSAAKVPIDPPPEEAKVPIEKTTGSSGGLSH